ncbi:hypothetical protein [Paenirhodobacter populi]|uniref:hypothetical protein n=1 Tax=Paenirhodobacter populi TaxID=2306993 RepID=UPI000FE40E4E|nr:hypothetical protein [Sinirhodobacter populi]RWR07075.1 hypothetical protein D2T32_12395 [Sinirhodobacter populi]
MRYLKMGRSREIASKGRNLRQGAPGTRGDRLMGPENDPASINAVRRRRSDDPSAPMKGLQIPDSDGDDPD